MKPVNSTKDATRTLRRMPANTAKLIRSKIKAYAADSASHADNVKKLKGREDISRLRVSKWRVIMDEQGDVLEILDVGSRGSIY